MSTKHPAYSLVSCIAMARPHGSWRKAAGTPRMRIPRSVRLAKALRPGAACGNSPRGEGAHWPAISGRVRLPAQLMKRWNRPMRSRPIALCLGLGVTLGFALAASAGYDVTILQDVGGQGISHPYAVNDAGQSVGTSYASSGVDAVLWSASGKATVLQDVGGQGVSDVGGINDSGWSVGYSFTTANFSRFEAVLWSPSGKATVLQEVGGYGISSAGSINASGQSVGASYTSCSSQGCSSDAVLWSPSGKRGIWAPFWGQPGAGPKPWGRTIRATSLGMASTTAGSMGFCSRQSPSPRPG